MNARRQLPLLESRPIRMDDRDEEFLRTFTKALSEGPVAPSDPRYVPVFTSDDDAEDDPIRLLARMIRFADKGESVQLFSGYIGSGKSTQLLRLKSDLEQSGFFVLRFDIEDYLSLSTPVDISDFLICLAGAVGEQLERTGIVAPESFWSRAGAFLQELRVEIPEVSAAPKATTKTASGELGAELGLGLKLNIRRNPGFRTLLQRTMEGHLASLVTQASAYFAECVQAIRAHTRAPNKQVVLLVDSIEHIRGTYSNEADVRKSIENLFAVQSEKLRLASIHVVYTVHPYLRFRLPTLTTTFDSNIYTLPVIKVRERSGAPYPPGIRLIREMVSARGDWARLLGHDNESLDRIIQLSGGYLRDLFGVLRDIILRAKKLPVSARVVDKAIAQRRSEYLPIADDDALWLDKIAELHGPALPTKDHLLPFANLIEQNRVFCYQNGEEWFDIHPLIRDHVREQAAKIRAAATPPASKS